MMPVRQVSQRCAALRVAIFWALASTSAASAQPAASAPAAVSVAVHPLKTLGLDPETLQRLEEVLRGEMERVPGIDLSETAASRAAATEIACDGKPACLGAFATKLGASVAVYGVVAALGESYNITLKAVDKDAKNRGRIQKTIGGEESVLIDGIRGAAYQLLRPDLYVGKLELQVPVAGAEVQIDGRTVGQTPLSGPIHGLSPGKHALKIISKGYSDFDKFVEVRFQRTSVVGVDLEGSSVSGVIYREEPPPPLVAVLDVPKVVPETALNSGLDPDAEAPEARSHALRWAGVGEGAAGLLSGAGGWFFANRANRTSDALTTTWANENRGPDASLDGADWESYQADSKLAKGLYVGAGVGLAAGIGLVLWDTLGGKSAAPARPSDNEKDTVTGDDGESSISLLVSPAPYVGVRVRF